MIYDFGVIRIFILSSSSHGLTFTLIVSEIQ